MRKPKKSNVRILVEEGKKNQFYKRVEWTSKIRPMILERDHHECQRCLHKWDSEKHPNTRPKRLTRAKAVHHIYPVEKYPEYAKEPWNMVSLCNRCHNEVEGRSWFNYKSVKKKKTEINEERW